MTTTACDPPHVLITGGSAGIGLGLARRYLAAGALVLVTGRDRSRLDDAAASHPGLLTCMSDLADPDAREALALDVLTVLPRLSVLINNAGIQRRVPLARDVAPWAERQAEIDILLAAPVHLTSLLVPAMLRIGGDATIVNVTSGGAIVPQPFAPVYAACKAALHSHTVTLRHALADTRILVKELIPPAVATGLAGPSASHGAPLDAFCDAVFPALCDRHSTEIGFGVTASDAFTAPRALERDLFDRVSTRFEVATYARP